MFLAEYMEMGLLLSAFCSFFGVRGGGGGYLWLGFCTLSSSDGGK